MTEAKIIGIITQVKGECHMGHKVGDRFELSIGTCGGLCGAFYHDIFPLICTLQFGGKFPWEVSGKLLADCGDRTNTVTIELHRE